MQPVPASDSDPPPAVGRGPASTCDALIRSFVHVARNQLAATSGLSEMLADPELTHQDRAHIQHMLEHLVARLVPLLDDLSHMNELEQGQHTPSLKTIDLEPLVGAAADTLQEDRPARWVDLSVAPGVPAVRADAHDTGVIVDTLLRNAADYTSGDIFIRLAVDAARSQVCLTIADQGPAWPTEWHEPIFARLSKLPETSGPGPRHSMQLGLYVARQLARRMGGDLQLELNASGGNDFKISLPIGRPPS